MDLASVTITLNFAVLFILALSLTSLLRYVGIRASDYSNKEPLMMNFPRKSLRFVSCVIETVWAGIISAVVGLYAGGTAAKSI